MEVHMSPTRNPKPNIMAAITYCHPSYPYARWAGNLQISSQFQWAEDLFLKAPGYCGPPLLLTLRTSSSAVRAASVRSLSTLAGGMRRAKDRDLLGHDDSKLLLVFKKLVLKHTQITGDQSQQERSRIGPYRKPFA